MHGGGIDVLGEVLVARGGTLGPYSTTSLLAEVGQRRALDVAKMADGDDDRIVGIEVLGIELVLVGDDLGAAGIAILLLHLQQFLLHDLLAALGIVEDFLQFATELHQIVELLVELVHAQAGELRETHVDNGLRLQFVEFEARLKVALCIGRRLRVADDVHHLINIVHGYDESLENVGTFLGLLQVVARTTDGDVVAVLNEIVHALLEREQTGTAFYKGDVID